MDIDHFKIVNDRCGHAAGDQLLLEVATTVARECGPEDVLARLGGDEFALIRWCCDRKEAADLAERVRSSVNEIDFVWEDRRYSVSLSVGITCFGEAHTDTTDQALGLADAACFIAKEKGRNRIQISRNTDEEVIHRNRDMDNASRLKRALADDRIELYLQRIVPLGGDSQESAMFEVLTRLRAADGRLLLPGSYIPAAERFGMIDALDRHVLRKAFENLQAASSIPPRANYFINLSGATLASDGFANFVEELLQARPRVCASQICFEVTETSAVANVRRTAESMRLLIEKGFRFALDDFGSGMASFSYLRQLPIHYVKIDGEFVRTVVEDETNAMIVASVIQVARSMNVRTIAEYIENDELVLKLTHMGADFGQGFGLARPVPMNS